MLKCETQGGAIYECKKYESLAQFFCALWKTQSTVKKNESDKRKLLKFQEMVRNGCLEFRNWNATTYIAIRCPVEKPTGSVT